MSQDYKNHKRFYPLFHYFTIPLAFLALIFTLYLCKTTQNPFLGLIFFAFLLITIVAIMARTFALKAQDRAIRAEESLRYFILAQKPFPGSIKLSQILALRFASDEEFLALTDRAVSENLSSDEIKKAIKNWRGDYHRI
ncbi:hypothetical protein ASE74_09835 [Pedobacter sp. Leaf216]|uniref:DUF6526 family protein n=1 Tax=Pedobacter sp. Leaf216 TaxID=1735684 RepID=UPI0006FCFA0C|nr:DUF6526 family protein [Pedobacter sp. Leaf216]KQM66174.1 hypothetical protein ASE74_09835 [Pedobacter sp. Leaf216]